MTSDFCCGSVYVAQKLTPCSPKPEGSVFRVQEKLEKLSAFGVSGFQASVQTGWFRILKQEMQQLLFPSRAQQRVELPAVVRAQPNTREVYALDLNPNSLISAPSMNQSPPHGFRA